MTKPPDRIWVYWNQYYYWASFRKHKDQGEAQEYILVKKKRKAK